MATARAIATVRERKRGRLKHEGLLDGLEALLLALAIGVEVFLAELAERHTLDPLSRRAVGVLRVVNSLLILIGGCAEAAADLGCRLFLLGSALATLAECKAPPVSALLAFLERRKVRMRATCSASDLGGLASNLSS